MGRQNTVDSQGGSTLSFIIVGVVLVCLVVGGVFALRNQGDRGIVPEKAPSVTVNTGSKGEKTELQKGTESTGAGSAGAAKNGASSTQNSKSVNKSTDANRTAPAPVVNRSTSDSSLPQSGPANTLATIAMLSVLAGVGVAYAQSRRQLAISLNR